MMRSTISLSSFLFLLFFSVAAASRPPVSDREALLAIKEELVDHNASLVDWSPTPDNLLGFPTHCNWTGVSCNTWGRVTALDLHRRNLKGRLSAAILLLNRLVRLDISGNSLVSLPLNFSGLPFLRVFDVSDNKFCGRFPTGLGVGSSELRVVNASANDFSGRLPEDLANATALEVLDLRGGYFDGPIPSSYGNLSMLRFLGLSGNELSGRLPIELGRLASLETLIAGYNRFDGPIPWELGELRKLQYLDLVAAGFVGSIPREFANLTDLETMYLFRNRITGTIPREIGNLTSLARLDLSDNEIAGAIPEELAGMANLQLLNLMSNRFNGQVPSGLGELTRLQVVELWNNSLTGPLPPDLGRNSRLRWLDVSTNRLSGAIPWGLCTRRSLEKLILFDNAFTGRIPAGIAACDSLVRVRIHRNRLDGTIPPGFGRLPVIERLELAHNELTGAIPVDIAGSGSLSFIDLSHNRLRFPLPPDLLSIPTLQTFLVSGNAITGGLPASLRQCPSLAILDLSGNNLTGPIPESIATCGRLVRLDLSGNSFTGEIPEAVAGMPALSQLDLSRNWLSGRIPARLGISPALEAVNLSFNMLSGPVPANGVMKTVEPSGLTGNPSLCGGVLPACEMETSQRHYDEHLAGAVARWVAGASAVVLVGVLAIGSKWACERWGVVGSGRSWSGKAGEGEWPWRMVAYQRVSFSGGEVIAGVKEGNVIGMGATGVVYRVELPRHGAIVAVKKLWNVGGGAPAGDGVALEEVNLLGRLRHRNIVTILGFLHSDSDVAVVYEYVENGSLWEALHGGDGKQTKLLDWITRYDIAVGVAAGLAYLHHDCRPPVVHRDVKSGNILLDGRMEAKIADFGLARASAGKWESVSMVIGSHGYIAPECAYTLKVDERCDVYSFGVVLMELVTGRKPVDADFGEAQDLVAWVCRSLGPGSGGDRPEDVLDPTVAGQCQRVMEEMVLVLRIARLCTASSPKNRPSMRDVVTMLAEAKPRRKSGGGGGNTAVKSMGVSDKPIFPITPVDN